MKRIAMAFKGKSAAACAVVLLLMWPGAAMGADQGGLQITVLEGEGAFNDIQKGTARAPVVEVRDEANHPLENVRVVFQLPESGPSGRFEDGTQTYITTTNQEGRASARGLKPNRVEGPFQILVTASAGDRAGLVAVH